MSKKTIVPRNNRQFLDAEIDVTPAARRGRRGDNGSFTPAPTEKYRGTVMTFQEFQNQLPRLRPQRKITPAKPLPKHPDEVRILLECVHDFAYCLRHAVRRNAERLKPDRVAWYELVLNQNFQSELATLRPQFADYLDVIGSYDPTVRQQRLDRIEQTRQAIIDEPTAETLREYQEALKAKPSESEQIIYSMMESTGLNEIELADDLAIVAEFKSLRDQLAELPAFEVSWRNYQKEVETVCQAGGADYLRDPKIQKMMVENQRQSDEHRQYQKMGKRLEQLSNLEICKNL